MGNILSQAVGDNLSLMKYFADKVCHRLLLPGAKTKNYKKTNLSWRLT